MCAYATERRGGGGISGCYKQIKKTVCVVTLSKKHYRYDAMKYASRLTRLDGSLSPILSLKNKTWNSG